MENSLENRNENNDLRFVPFETKDDIFNSDVNWFPNVRLNTPALDTVTSEFIEGFSNPINYMENLLENTNANKDLEFVPFETKDNIFNSDANWFPNVRLNNLTLDTITNEFITGFSNPVNRTSLDREEFNNILYNYEDDYSYKNQEIESDITTDFSNPVNGTSLDGEEFNNNLYNYYDDYSYKNEKVESNKIEIINGESEKRKLENRKPENNKKNNSKKSSKKSKNNEKDRIQEINSKEPPHMKILREYNLLYLEEENRLETLSLSEEIYKDMVEDNQEVFDVLRAYEIPDPMVDIIVKKLIRSTLDNCSK